MSSSPLTVAEIETLSGKIIRLAAFPHAERREIIHAGVRHFWFFDPRRATLHSERGVCAVPA